MIKVLGVLAIAVAMAGCSSAQKVVTTPVTSVTVAGDTTTPAPAIVATSPPATAAPTTRATAPSKKTAHVGDTLAIAATQESPAAQVTLVKIVDPAQSDNQFEGADAGNRLVGVQIRVMVTSGSSSQADPDNDLTLYDTQGQSYSSGYSTLSGCQAFASGLVLSPNEPALGCVSFEVPTTATIARAQFTPSSGFADVTAEWQVP